MEYRLNKYISSSGFCSRREADKLIEDGLVSIDDKPAVLGQKVLAGQKVKVDEKLIKHINKTVYLALNKPVGVVCTTDPKEKNNIADFVNHEERIFPIGRLDKDSQGLILLTNDGDIVNKILRAGNNHKKDYIVTVDKAVTPDFLTKMTQGVPILGKITKKCNIEKIDAQTFKITLTEGLNRQIRRMCEYFGYEVIKLERIQIMNIKLGDLKRGQWRELIQNELDFLFSSLEYSQKTAPEKPIQTKEAQKKDTNRPKETFKGGASSKKRRN